jgi:hypothetical protein
MVDTSMADFNKPEHFNQLTGFLESGEVFQRKTLFIK